MRVALVVAGKELRQRLRDRSAIIIGFVAPTVLAAIVTGAFGGGFGPGQVSFHLPIAVADLDHSQLSKIFRTQVLGSPGLRKQLTIRDAASEKDAEAMVRNNGFDAAFVIPSGFQAAVASGARSDIEVIRNQVNPIAGDIAVAVASAFTDRVSATRVSVFTALRSSGGKAD